MRYIAFILFLAATFCFWNSISTFVTLSPDEQWYYAGESKPGRELQAYLTMHEAQKARLLDGTRRAFLSAAFLTASLYLLLPKHREGLRFSRFAPHPVDLTHLVSNVKNHPFPSRIGLPHFFASRRARCRAAESRLADKMEEIFEPRKSFNEEHNL